MYMYIDTHENSCTLRHIHIHTQAYHYLSQLHTQLHVIIYTCIQIQYHPFNLYLDILTHKPTCTCIHIHH